MKEPILHHYDTSNFAEKVRLALGYKGLRWDSVTIPPVAPKPDLTPLTGGYRRTPVLQIGADVYCDTALIVAELERRQPEPTLYPAPYAAHAIALAHWAETRLFRPISLYVSGSNPDAFPAALQADRAAMRGLPPPTAEAMRAAAARNAPLVRAQIPAVEGMLGDGRDFLLGPAATVADLAVYHALWFITGRRDRLAHELGPYPAIGRWMARVRGFGHGEHAAMSTDAALRIAAEATPAALPPPAPWPEDPPIGSPVRVRADDYGRDPVEGELAYLDAERIALRRIDPHLGELLVHFPRLGYELRPRRGDDRS